MSKLALSVRYATPLPDYNYPNNNKKMREPSSDAHAVTLAECFITFFVACVSDHCRRIMGAVSGAWHEPATTATSHWRFSPTWAWAWQPFLHPQRVV